MLETTSDFTYESVSGIGPLITTNGTALVQPMPVRAGVVLPASDEAGLGFCGDIRAVDPAYLLEAALERQAFLGKSASGLAPKVNSFLGDDIKRIAEWVMEAARDWEVDCPGNVYCKDDAGSELSGWEQVNAIAVTWSYSEFWAGSGHYTPNVVPAELSSWRNFLDDDGRKEFEDFSLKSRFVKYALRDYLTPPWFFGLKCDDADGRMYWKSVDGFGGFWGYEAMSRDVMGLYSDLERQNTAMLCNLYPTPYVTVNEETETDNDYVYEESGSTKTHDDCSDGCGTFHHNSPRDPQTDSQQNRTDSSTTYGVVFGDLCSAPDVFASIYPSVSVSSCPVGEASLESETSTTNRGITNCHDADCNHVGYGVYDFWTSKTKNTTKSSAKREAGGGFSVDLSSRMADGAELVEAYVVLFAMSETVDAEQHQEERAFVYNNNRSYRTGTVSRGSGTCNVAMFVGSLQGTVSGKTATFYLGDMGEIPDPSGGVSVTLEIENDTSAPDGDELSPARSETDGTAKFSAKRIVGFGPLIVKFKPKSQIGD